MMCGSDRMATISLAFLGSFQVLRGDAPVTHFRGEKVRELLELSGLEADRPHACATLAALLWPDQLDEPALRNRNRDPGPVRTAYAPRSRLAARRPYA